MTLLRTDHEADLLTRISTLKDVIARQNDTIALWREDHDRLVTRLHEAEDDAENQAKTIEELRADVDSLIAERDEARRLLDARGTTIRQLMAAGVAAVEQRDEARAALERIITGEDHEPADRTPMPVQLDRPDPECPTCGLRDCSPSCWNLNEDHGPGCDGPLNCTCPEPEGYEGPSCSICDGLGHGYPGGPPCPLEERGGYDPDPF